MEHQPELSRKGAKDALSVMAEGKREADEDGDSDDEGEAADDDAAIGTGHTSAYSAAKEEASLLVMKEERYADRRRRLYRSDALFASKSFASTINSGTTKA